MWTGEHKNLEYSGQITPYHGKVNAEIIKRNAETGGHEGRTGELVKWRPLRYFHKYGIAQTKDYQ